MVFSPRRRSLGTFIMLCNDHQRCLGQQRVQVLAFVALVAISGGCASANREHDGLVRAQGQDFDPSSPTRTGLSPYSPCWYGNYFGPGNNGYDVAPIDALDAAAREHDLAYDRYGAAGPRGALTCIKVGRPDLNLPSHATKACPAIPPTATSFIPPPPLPFAPPR